MNDLLTLPSKSSATCGTPTPIVPSAPFAGTSLRHERRATNPRGHRVQIGLARDSKTS